MAEVTGDILKNVEGHHYTTEEALQVAAKSYKGLTGEKLQ